MSRYLFIFFVILVIPKVIFGQQFPNNNSTNPQDFNYQDTAQNENDTLISKNGFFSLFKGKPGRAAFYSLVIPSGGQIYNRKWWKVPLALGIDVSLGYVIDFNTKKYNASQDEYVTTLATDPKNQNIAYLKIKRDFYRKGKENAWLYFVIGHMATVVDAFVDRHLMDFDVSDNLTFEFNSDNHLPMVANVTYKIHLNKKRSTQIYPSWMAH